MKILFLSVIMMALTVSYSNAQTGSASKAATAPVSKEKMMKPHSDGDHSMEHKMGTPEERATRMTERITKMCSLDAATAQSVKAIALARDTKIDEIHTGTLDNKAKEVALKANKQEFEAKLKGVLTADQFAKYQESSHRNHKMEHKAASTDKK